MTDTAEPIRVMVIDDQAMFRDSVAGALATLSELQVVAHVSRLAEALEFLRSHSADVVLLDYDLGVERGTEFLPRARALRFGGAVLVVTGGLSTGAAALLIRQGVSGIVLKSESLASLVDSIRTAASGVTCFDYKYLQAAQELVTLSQSFTEREERIIRLLLTGLANKEIAARVGLSEASVKASLRRIFEVTGARTRGQLVCVLLEKYADELKS